MVAGDEYAATRSGNNNWYGHDNEMTWFDWDSLEEQRDGFFRFYRCAVDFQLVLLQPMPLTAQRSAGKHAAPAKSAGLCEALSSL